MRKFTKLNEDVDHRPDRFNNPKLHRLVEIIFMDCKMDFDQVEENAPEVVDGVKQMILDFAADMNASKEGSEHL
jgi:hypothetical protein